MRAGSLWLTGISRATRLLPPRADRPLATLAAYATTAFRPQRARWAQINAAVLFPKESERELRKLGYHACQSYARFILDYLRSLGRPVDELWKRVEIRLDPSVEGALQSGRGIICCAAHIGNWEIGAMGLGKLGVPVAVVAGPQYAEAWSEAIRRAKGDFGIQVIDPDDSPRPLMRILGQGGIVCLLIDGDGYRRGRVTRFANREVRLPSGPARLADRSAALLVGGTCFSDGTFRFRIGLQSLEENLTEETRGEETLHTAVAGWLEDSLKKHPGEWCIFRPFFAVPSEGIRFRSLSQRRHGRPEPKTGGSDS